MSTWAFSSAIGFNPTVQGESLRVSSHAVSTILCSPEPGGNVRTPRAPRRRQASGERVPPAMTDSLYRTLRSTNPIENLNGSVMHFARNVRRWRDASMMLRWVETGLHEAQQQFRRLKGFRDMKRLVAALDRVNTNSGVDSKKQVA